LNFVVAPVNEFFRVAGRQFPYISRLVKGKSERLDQLSFFLYRAILSPVGQKFPLNRMP
jgi:hypothetical protein